jgi:CheY-like chemotaxis protein
MNILIVEDDPYKYNHINSLVTSVFQEAEISHFNSVHGTRKYLRENFPDKIILDMSLPTHPPVIGEGNPVSLGSGGIEILLALRSKKQFDLPVAILTQYANFEIEDDYYTLDEAPEALARFYGLKNVIAVLYEHGSPDWENLIKKFLEQQ